MKFLAFDQLGPSPNKPNFMVCILRKISGLQKLLIGFSRNCRNQNFDFGPNQIRPPGWDCNRFCWSCSQLCHHHYFWEFLFNELLQWLFRINHLASKTSFIWNFLWFFFWLGSYSTLAWPCHMDRVGTG